MHAMTLRGSRHLQATFSIGGQRGGLSWQEMADELDDGPD